MNSNWRKIKEAWDHFAALKGVELEVEEINGIESKMDKYSIHFSDQDCEYFYKSKLMKADTAFDVRETFCEYHLDKALPYKISYLYKKGLLGKKTLSSSKSINNLIKEFKHQFNPSIIEITEKLIKLRFPYIIDSQEQFTACETLRKEIIKTATNSG